MFLPDSELLRLGPSMIHPFDPGRVQPASYDLTLAPQLLVPVQKSGPMDLRVDSPADHMLPILMSASEPFDIAPHQCVLGATTEVVHCPNDHVISVEGKSSLARMFLVPHVAAGWIDPGFKGQVTLEIVNFGPWVIRLYPGMAIAQMNVMPLTSPVRWPYGSVGLGSHYQGQLGPTASSGRRG